MIVRGREEVRDIELLQADRPEFPQLQHGWRFVRGGPTSGPIPPDKFTGFFKRREVPYAIHGNDYYEAHDALHVQTYQRIFRSALLGNLIQEAAHNTGSDPLFSETFTDALDGLGDILLEVSDATEKRAGAVSKLGTLVQLAKSTDTPLAPHTHQQMADQLAAELGL